MSLSAILIVALIAVLLVARAAISTVGQSQRLVIERFGRFSRCGGPGLRLTLPFVEAGRIIELNEYVADWKGMTEPEIEQRLLKKLYG